MGNDDQRKQGGQFDLLEFDVLLVGGDCVLHGMSSAPGNGHQLAHHVAWDAGHLGPGGLGGTLMDLDFLSRSASCFSTKSMWFFTLEI